MSTAMSSARTGATRAGPALLNYVAPKKACPGSIVSRTTRYPRQYSTLVTEMHKGLYPHLYDANGRPKERILPSYTEQKKSPPTTGTKIKVSPPKPAIKFTCPDPVSAVTKAHIAVLDPTGARTRLFAKDNPECARVGDILLVRQRTGDPFAGVCIDIRRRGVDTAILLRGQLTRVGVEMWYKIYSPLVEGIEVVQRAAKRARRARLTYMRKEKHDRGNVENVVRMYMRQKAALGVADAQKKRGAAAAAMGGKRGGKKGKKK